MAPDEHNELDSAITYALHESSPTNHPDADGLSGLVQSLKKSKKKQPLVPKFGAANDLPVTKTMIAHDPLTEATEPSVPAEGIPPPSDTEVLEPSGVMSESLHHKTAQLAERVAWLETRLQEAEQSAVSAQSRVEAMAGKFDDMLAGYQQLFQQYKQLESKMLSIEQSGAQGGELPAPEGFQSRVAALADLARQADEAENKIQMLLAQRKKVVQRRQELEQTLEPMLTQAGDDDPQVVALKNQIEALRGQAVSMDRVLSECKQLVATIYQHIEFGFQALARSAQQSSTLL